MTRPLAGRVPILLALLLAYGPIARCDASATRPQKCAVAKLRAASKRSAAKVACEQKAILTAAALSAACLSKADAAFAAAFRKAEAKPGCATTGDSESVGAAVDECVNALVADLPSVTTTTSDPTTTTATTLPPGDSPGPGPTQQCTVTPNPDGFFQLTSVASDYTVRLPPTYDAANPAPTRLVVLLHGCGDTAANFATWAVVPTALRATQDYIGMAVGGRDGQCWSLPQDEAKVTAAIDHVRSCFYVHQKKIVIGGYSSGALLAYDLGLKNAATYSGILVENAGLSQAVGSGNVTTVLQAAAWHINVAHTARLSDSSFLIAGVRADRDAMLAAGIPLQYRELAGTSDGTSDDWSGYLLPKIATWSAP